mmetsp:Transcript_31695/g.68123  ORF Transcript_31695/g.68123 Transcript_31695/m.68123 type:complete len:307 (+) Transcript_31695:229-1149(+)
MASIDGSSRLAGPQAFHPAHGESSRTPLALRRAAEAAAADCRRRVLREARVDHIAVCVGRLLRRQLRLADEGSHLALEDVPRDVVIDRRVDRQALEQALCGDRPHDVGVRLPQPLRLSQLHGGLRTLIATGKPLGHVCTEVEQDVAIVWRHRLLNLRDKMSGELVGILGEKYIVFEHEERQACAGSARDSLPQERVRHCAAALAGREFETNRRLAVEVVLRIERRVPLASHVHIRRVGSTRGGQAGDQLDARSTKPPFHRSTPVSARVEVDKDGLECAGGGGRRRRAERNVRRVTAARAARRRQLH